MSRSSQPILNVPAIVASIAAALAIVHVARSLIDSETDIGVLLWFAFVPARYDTNFVARVALPGGEAADAWTFVTYAFLHGDYTHLLVNLVWLLAFGTPVARRLGGPRFAAFFAVTAAAGALAHLITNFGAFAPLVGASAAISGAMAAAVRFAFEAGGPLGFLRDPGAESYRVPAAPLLIALRNPQVLVFLAVWFAINLAFSFGTLDALGEGSIAWQAHLGGFLAGLLLFPLFDPIARPS